MVSTASLSGTTNVKLPSKSATVPTDVLFFNTIAAPIKGSSLLSRTLPVTVKLWAETAKLHNAQKTNKIPLSAIPLPSDKGFVRKNCCLMFFIAY